jgi:carbon storage regulator CsrA
MTSTPTWSNAAGCSATSVFFSGCPSPRDSWLKRRPRRSDPVEGLARMDRHGAGRCGRAWTYCALLSPWWQQLHQLFGRAHLEYGGSTMLVLSRKTQESVIVGGSEAFDRILKVTVLEVCGGKVRLGFEVDGDIPVHRAEVWERIHSAPRIGPARDGPLIDNGVSGSTDGGSPVSHTPRGGDHDVPSYRTNQRGEP